MQQHYLRGEKFEIPHLLQPGIMPANTITTGAADAMTPCTLHPAEGDRLLTLLNFSLKNL